MRTSRIFGMQWAMFAMALCALALTGDTSHAEELASPCRGGKVMHQGNCVYPDQIPAPSHQARASVVRPKSKGRKLSRNQRQRLWELACWLPQRAAQRSPRGTFSNPDGGRFSGLIGGKTFRYAGNLIRTFREFLPYIGELAASPRTPPGASPHNPMVKWAAKVAQLPPYSSSYRLQGRKVGRINPAFLTWFEKNLIPPANTSLCGVTAKTLYHAEFRGLVRAHAEAYLYMVDRGSFSSFSLRDYEKQIHIKNTRYAADCQSFAVQSPSRWVARPYRSRETCRFWFRRTADGSRKQLVSMMKRLLPKFDPAYWKTVRARFAKRAPKIPGADSLCSAEKCKRYGRCTFVNRHYRSIRCSATKNADCKRSVGCRTQKRCYALDGRCSKSATCRQSDACKIYGRCTRDRKTGRCVARHTRECRSSTSCKKYGNCRARDGRCVVANHQDCRSSERCKSYGRCSLIGSRCRAGSDSDCSQSEACQRFKRCKAENGMCKAPKQRANCKQSSPKCRFWGRCAPRGSKCVAVSAADCRKSLGCQYEANCALDTSKHRCVANSDPECRRSKFCKLKGRCSLDKKAHRCQATSAKDCAQSRDCRKRGECTPKNGRCRPDSEQHCQTAAICRSEGLCRYRSLTSSCIARSDQDCAKSTECARSGKCHEKSGKCRARSKRDCMQSEGCAKFGRCKFRFGSCVKGGSRPTTPNSAI